MYTYLIEQIDLLVAGRGYAFADATRFRHAAASVLRQQLASAALLASLLELSKEKLLRSNVYRYHYSSITSLNLT